MALAWALQNGDANSNQLLIAAQPTKNAVRDAPVDNKESTVCGSHYAKNSQGTRWPGHYKTIDRLRYESIEKLIEVLRPYVKKEEPVIVEGCGIIDTVRWQDLSYLSKLLGEKKVLVKRSPNRYFRYFDTKKNTGRFDFKEPLEEFYWSMEEFLCESQQLIEKGLPERMYLQETMNGHEEMAQEFKTWNWKLLLLVSKAFNWGLPDSNEMFVGMESAETPLHYDERENFFYQVRGRKEICFFPCADYCRLYPFPCCHPCDRQSMVGSPLAPDHEAFPKFKEATGHVAEIGPGDMVYIPYGWFHWLRNIDHLAVSMSFWSLAPPSNVSTVPTSFTDKQLTRICRNLEVMISDQAGPENLNTTMLQIQRSIQDNKSEDGMLKSLRSILAGLAMSVEKQDALLLRLIQGRFGINWQRHVIGGGVESLE